MSLSDQLCQFVVKGQFTCNGQVAVVVPCNKLLATSSIIITPSNAAPSANAPSVSALVAGTSFSVICGGANAQVYNYVVLN